MNNLILTLTLIAALAGACLEDDVIPPSGLAGAYEGRMAVQMTLDGVLTEYEYESTTVVTDGPEGVILAVDSDCLLETTWIDEVGGFWIENPAACSTVTPEGVALTYFRGRGFIANDVVRFILWGDFAVIPGVGDVATDFGGRRAR